jgi:hypothetical protein
MAHDEQRPHDRLFRTVFADPEEAAALLRAHLPESLACDLRWSSLTLHDRSFVDDHLRDSEFAQLFCRLGAQQHTLERRGKVFAELCEIVDETVELYIQDGKPLPEPTSGRDYANKMLLIV